MFFYLTTHSTHFIYGYIASDIWYRTTQIVREETRCRHIGYSFRLVARVLLYAPSHRQDSIYHGLCYTSRGHYRMRHSIIDPLYAMNQKHECHYLSYNTVVNHRLEREKARYFNTSDNKVTYLTSLKWISRSIQCFTTGATKTVACAILYVGWCI